MKNIAIVLALILASCSSSTQDVVKVVSQNGDGDYTTVKEAFEAVPQNYDKGKWIIKIKPGRYYEQVVLNKGQNNVVLLGEDAATTVITYDDYAGSGSRRPMQSVTIAADDFIASNITFENPHQNIREQPGENSHSQATALHVTGDRIALYNCRLIGNQDTFYGRGTGRIYIKDSYVEGNVDYIYGSSVMLFDRCVIFSNQHDSYITAGRTLPEMKFGFVFMDCKLDAKEVGELDHDGVPFQNFYLGRPWHEEPQVVFIRCEEPISVYPAGWTYMYCEPKLFAEYKCTGPGATPERLAQREMGGRQLTKEEAEAYTIKNIFSKETYSKYEADWMPAKRCTYKY